MPRNALGSFLHYLHRMSLAKPDEASDAGLLQRFVSHGDQAAFEVLVWRHGPMVLGLCQRLLRQEQDSEDVFQATFLTLVRKAGSISKKEALASWLYKVAFRIACRVRTPIPSSGTAAEDVPGPEREADVIWRELRSVLDQEVSALPESYRRAIVLCYFEGKTHEEAAHLLRCPKGTVAAWVARARERLRRRLTQRGLALSAPLLATILAEKAAAGPVAAELVQSTGTAALAHATGKTVLATRAIVLSEGVLHMMWLNKMKLAVGGFLALALVLTGIGLVVRQTWAAQGQEQPQQVGVAQKQLPKVVEPGASKTKDPKKAAVEEELANLRLEIAELRLELATALKELKTLREFLRAGAVNQEPEPTYRGKPARFWLEQLRDTDSKFRIEALEALGNLASKNKDLIPVLVSALKEPNYKISSTAGKGLARLGAEVVPTLVEIIKTRKSPEAYAAAEALAKVGPGAKSALPFLTEMLKDKDTSLRSVAAAALGAIGPDAKGALPALTEALELAVDAEAERKSPKFEPFSFSSLPSVIAHAMLRIDPQIQTALPSMFQETFQGGGFRGDGGRPDADSMALWRQVVEAVKKHYKK